MINRTVARTRHLPLAAVLSSLLVLLLTSFVQADAGKRPFWTEKSAFLEGEDLFVVGVASHAHTLEEGRQQAFERGKIELMNYAQVTTLEARGLIIETQMTYEEVNEDGTATVFRLLRVPVQRLLEIQGQLQSQGHAQGHALDHARQELLVHKHSLEDKAVEIEQQKREVELLLKHLEVRYPETIDASSQSAQADSLTSRMERAETKLAIRERDLMELSRRAKDRIAHETVSDAQRCRLLVLGMTAAEVKTIMGEPRRSLSMAPTWWFYGRPVTINLHFRDEYLSAISYDAPNGSENGCPPFLSEPAPVSER